MNCEYFRGNGEYIVKGVVETEIQNPKVLYWAANPPDHRASFSGSGLPFPNAEVAFENTPNRGAVKAVGGHFTFNITFPNSYYIGLGSKLVEPSVHYQVEGESKVHTLKLKDSGIPYRSIPERKNVMFYAGKEQLPLRSQEQMIREHRYPTKNRYYKNFWGSKPPQ